MCENCNIICHGIREKFLSEVLASVIFFNTLRSRRNEQLFADNIFKRIFFNENVWISITISLKFVRKGSNNNIPALVQIMAWRRSGDKQLSEPMMVSLPTHICVTRLQWVNMTSHITIVRISVWIRSNNIYTAIAHHISFFTATHYHN